MNPQVQELMEKLDTHRTELLALMGGMSEEEASRHPGGEWSAKQQLAHLAEAERAWLGWAMTVKDNPGTNVGPPAEEGQIFQAEVARADDRPLSYWTDRLEVVRGECLRMIEEAGLGEEELQRKGIHRGRMEMTVLQFLRALYRHDRMHIDQISGRPSSFAPRG